MSTNVDNDIIQELTNINYTLVSIVNKLLKSLETDDDKNIRKIITNMEISRSLISYCLNDTVRMMKHNDVYGIRR